MRETKVPTMQYIMCPHCHAQYHPSEIFMPEDFLGRPDNLVKDALGKILYVDYEDGKEPCFEEKFECEYCGKPFVVEGSCSYRSKEEEEELDFTEEYVSLLN